MCNWGGLLMKIPTVFFRHRKNISGPAIVFALAILEANKKRLLEVKTG